MSWFFRVLGSRRLKFFSDPAYFNLGNCSTISEIKCKLPFYHILGATGAKISSQV